MAGRESDYLERWLDKEVERPADEVIQKVTSGAKLKPADWKRLVTFLAAQDVRTPSRLFESFPRWNKILPSLMQDVLRDSVNDLAMARDTSKQGMEPTSSGGAPLPLRVVTEITPGQKIGKVEAKLLLGRSLWHYEIRHLITRTADILHQHRWTLLSPPPDLPWFTSDTPVVRLNYYSPGCYDFKGGWGVPGTDIFLPLSPHHLLYTQVGKKPPRRGERCSRLQAEELRRFIAESSDQMVIALKPDLVVAKLRPRLVDANLFQEEKERWHKWHESQSEAEQDL